MVNFRIVKLPLDQKSNIVEDALAKVGLHFLDVILRRKSIISRFAQLDTWNQWYSSHVNRLVVFFSC